MDVTQPDWRLDLPEDLRPREMKFIAEHITANLNPAGFPVLITSYRQLSGGVVRISKPRDVYHPRDGGATEKIRSVS
jgi:hypothetical protein